MRKTILVFVSFLLFVFGVSGVSAKTPDTSGWFEYKGYDGTHGFSVLFPSDWQVRTIDSGTQGFGPQNDSERDPVFLIKEFEVQTIDQVLTYFSQGGNSLLKSEDFLLKSVNENLIAKSSEFLNISSGKSQKRVLIKRGSTVIVISNLSMKYEDTFSGFLSSFKFIDNWKQYINFKDNYSFIFPSNFTVLNLGDDVQINASAKKNYFEVQKFESGSGYEDLTASQKINFHGIEGMKTLDRIIVKKNGTYFSLSNIDYEHVPEILESFEFFDIALGDDDFPYQHFPDIRNNHKNAESINSLFEQKVISGYTDGTFRPDGEINRAELTKMIVTTKINPNKTFFKNCFPDVKEQWFAPYICYAKAKGWVLGYEDGTFGPEKNINRAEALKIILTVIFNGKIRDSDKLKDTTVRDIDTSAWYAKYFVFSDNNNLLDKQHIKESGGGYYYYPNANISRKEVAQTIYLGKKLK